MQLYYFYLATCFSHDGQKQFVVLAESEEVARFTILNKVGVNIKLSDYLCEIYPANTVIVI